MSDLQSKLYAAFDKDPRPIADFLAWLVQSYNLTGPLRVLDVGCGPGRLLREYHRQGWQAVGLEPDPDFYPHAVREADQLDGVTVEDRGFNDISDIAAYDLVAAVNGPYAYLMTRDAQLDALHRAFHALKPGGILFLDIPNLLWFLRQEEEPPERVTVIDGQEIRFRAHYKYDLHDATFSQINEYVVREPTGEERKIYKTHPHAIITFPDLAHRARSVGFEELRTFNSYADRRCERLSGDRIMLAAQKPR